MKILYPGSLGATVDAVNEAFFFGRRLTVSQKQKTAGWLANRVGGRGSYAGMPGPTKKDFGLGIKLFTDEKVRSRAGTAI